MQPPGSRPVPESPSGTSRAASWPGPPPAGRWRASAGARAALDRGRPRRARDRVGARLPGIGWLDSRRPGPRLPAGAGGEGGDRRLARCRRRRGGGGRDRRRAARRGRLARGGALRRRRVRRQLAGGPAGRALVRARFSWRYSAWCSSRPRWRWPCVARLPFRGFRRRCRRPPASAPPARWCSTASWSEC